MAGAADIPAFRSMRTLRALRPLRAVSRWEGMRVSRTSNQRRRKPRCCLSCESKCETEGKKASYHSKLFLSLSFSLSEC